jgi:hypothetical protein
VILILDILERHRLQQTRTRQPVRLRLLRSKVSAQLMPLIVADIRNLDARTQRLVQTRLDLEITNPQGVRKQWIKASACSPKQDQHSPGHRAIHRNPLLHATFVALRSIW